MITWTLLFALSTSRYNVIAPKFAMQATHTVRHPHLRYRELDYSSTRKSEAIMFPQEQSSRWYLRKCILLLMQRVTYREELFMYWQSLAWIINFLPRVPLWVSNRYPRLLLRFMRRYIRTFSNCALAQASFKKTARRVHYSLIIVTNSRS